MSPSEDILIPPIEVTDAALREFRMGFRTHAHLAMVRQEKVNAASRRIENSSRLVDGLGQLKYRIDGDLYWHMRAIYGPGCWQDPDFLKACERDGVIQRVKGISEKIFSIFGLSPDAKINTQRKLGAGSWKLGVGERLRMLPQLPTPNFQLPATNPHHP